MVKRKKREPFGVPKKSFERKNDDSRKLSNSILIVCEDAKNSVAYFNALIEDYSLSAVRVTGDCGSAPSSVHDHAKKLYAKEEYDKIYCVIDKDQHDNGGNNYTNTLNAIKAGKKTLLLFPVFPVLNFGLFYILELVPHLFPNQMKRLKN